MVSGASGRGRQPGRGQAQTKRCMACPHQMSASPTKRSSSSSAASSHSSPSPDASKTMGRSPDSRPSRTCQRSLMTSAPAAPPDGLLHMQMIQQTSLIQVITTDQHICPGKSDAPLQSLERGRLPYWVSSFAEDRDAGKEGGESSGGGCRWEALARRKGEGGEGSHLVHSVCHNDLHLGQLEHGPRSRQLRVAGHVVQRAPCPAQVREGSPLNVHLPKGRT